MKISIYIKGFIPTIIFCLMPSCEDFVDLEAPDHKIVSEVVFGSDETAISAMTGIYYELVRASFSGGWQNSVTALTGLSADELSVLSTTNLTYIEFEQNEIMLSNTRNYEVWSSAYNIIYMTNSLLEGLENSDGLTVEVNLQLKGEAKFIRAFSYFYLINLYDAVPLLLTTDYQENAQASRNSIEDLYQHIQNDLQEAIEVLGTDYRDGQRTNVNRFVAMALLARVHLYTQNWVQAENLSSQVIAQTGSFELLEDLDQVFLANSKEALWQISPVGNGGVTTQTNEGSLFLIDPTWTAGANLKLAEGLVGSFETQDQRLMSWINYNEEINAHYAYKYKDRYSVNSITEYSMVLRLAEQYLIRAEARAMQGNLSGAIADMDKIRVRAKVDRIADSDPGIGKEALLDAIIKERRKEFFTEWGHRWLDVKRTGRASEILASKESLWQDSDVLYPIPEQERMKNANLDQNIGY